MPVQQEDLPLRAIIGIRNSGRKGDGEMSPAKQRELAIAIAARHGGRPTGEFRENGVSGGAPLGKRKFGEAIAACERDEADMIVWAFKSRNDRSIVEGSAACERMDAARKLLVAGDEILTHATRAGWQRATLSSFLDEDYRRACRENAERYIPDWIAAGWWLGGTPPPGWTKLDDHTVTFNEDYRAAIAKAFALRRARTPIRPIRDYLAAEHPGLLAELDGLDMSDASVRYMLRQPLYKGVLTFGRRKDGTFRWENATFYAVDPVVSPRVFDDVQKLRASRGRRAKSDRLLARQDILRCAGCNARMSVGASTKPGGVRYPHYACNTRACPAPSAIAADTVEKLVVARAKQVIEDAQETVSAGREYRAQAKQRDELARQLRDAGARLARLPQGVAADALVLEINDMQREHDELADKVERLSDLGSVETASAADLDSTDPDTLPARRRIIRRAVPVAVVHRAGTSVERVTFEPLPQLDLRDVA